MQMPNQPAPGLGSLSDSGIGSASGSEPVSSGVHGHSTSGHRPKLKSSIEFFAWFATTVALMLAHDSELETPLLVVCLVASVWIFGRRAGSRT
jgi:hypothetical protein